MKKNSILKLKKFVNKNLLILIISFFIFFIFIQKFNLVTNVYYIINKNFYERLSTSYQKKFFSGFCKKESHGYIIFVKTNFEHLSIPKIINFEEFRRKPYWIFFDNPSNISSKKIIILNYNKDINKKKNIININKYKILDNFENRCLYLEKHD